VPAVIHVIDPGIPGVGIFSIDDPDYLPLNTPCGQHVMHPMVGSDVPIYARSLYLWAKEHGYRWVGPECRVTDEGREITPHDFLPRRLMGQWLHWCYQTIVASSPSNVSVIHHRTTAVDIEPTENDREFVHLEYGGGVLVDQVILTVGHTPDHPEPNATPGTISPYPTSHLSELIAPGANVAVAGLGLVALDVVAELTAGRGGTFHKRDGHLRYTPCGREPVIYLFSRSGLPYATKSVESKDSTGEYVPVICTPNAAAALRPGRDKHLSRGLVAFRRDLLPLLLAEMQVRFYRESAAIENGPAAEDAVTSDLARAWSEGQFEAVIESYAARFGALDARRLLLGDGWESAYLSAEDYENGVYKEIQTDVAESLMEGHTSPVKAALETLRVLRDTVRSVVDFQGLDVESYLEFHYSFGNRIKAAVAGPPAYRAQELLALMDANIVRVPFGPSPIVEPVDGNGYVIRSTQLVEPYSQRVDHLVRGYLPDPTIERTRSPLLSRLSARGRIRSCSYGEVNVGSIDLTTDSNPVGSNGQVQDRIWVFGALTEGMRHFTHYVPSPRSRVRAFVDAEACAQQIFDRMDIQVKAHSAALTMAR
jgi:uncharacterized NAD(P)/FAD-binding protein YdhS